MSNLYKDSEGNKQEQYFYATANNQKSWVENFDDYSNHDYHNAAQSDADFAEEAGPWAKGLALLFSPIGLTNDVVSLKTGEDIYGNKAENEDNLLSVIDFITFGVGSSKVIKVVEKINDIIDYSSALWSAVRTFETEYKKQSK